MFIKPTSKKLSATYRWRIAIGPSKPRLENHNLSVVRKCVFGMFAATVCPCLLSTRHHAVKTTGPLISVTYRGGGKNDVNTFVSWWRGTPSRQRRAERHSFYSSSLIGSKNSNSRAADSKPGKTPVTHWIQGWVYPESFGGEKNRESSLSSSPVRDKSLYWLKHLGSKLWLIMILILWNISSYRILLAMHGGFIYRFYCSHIANTFRCLPTHWADCWFRFHYRFYVWTQLSA